MNWTCKLKFSFQGRVMCTSRCIYKQINLKLIPPKYISALIHMDFVYVFHIVRAVNDFWCLRVRAGVGRESVILCLEVWLTDLVWALVDLLQLYHAAHSIPLYVSLSMTWTFILPVHLYTGTCTSAKLRGDCHGHVILWVFALICIQVLWSIFLS